LSTIDETVEAGHKISFHNDLRNVKLSGRSLRKLVSRVRQDN